MEAVRSHSVCQTDDRFMGFLTAQNREDVFVCFLSQVAQAHSQFVQPEMLPSELQAQDETVNHQQQQVTVIQTVSSKVCTNVD